MVWSAKFLLVAYWLALATGTHIPIYTSSHVPQYNDKVMHFLAYAGLAFLLCVAWTAARGSFHWSMGLVIWVIVVMYGALDELSQIPVPGRSGDYRDWIADGLGAIIGIVSFWTVVMLWRKLHARPDPTESAEHSSCPSAAGQAVASDQ